MTLPEDDLFRGFGVGIELVTAADFLKIKETLTRIGIASKQTNVLWQSCHILHKRGKYAILHFKELFALDGRPSSMTDEDTARRNRIVLLLAQWNLVYILNKEAIETNTAPLSTIKVLNFKEKGEWELKTKYMIGKKKSG
jgi:hypothetical protein